MATLNKRLADLEARIGLSGQVVPVLTIAMSSECGDDAVPHEIEHQGMRWTQRPGESVEALQERATEAAVRLPRAAGRFPVITLCARRPALTPSLTQEH